MRWFFYFYPMKRLLAYPLTVLYFLAFGLCLVVFHPIQVLAFKVFGYEPHRRVVAFLNGCLMATTRILGTRYTISGMAHLPQNKAVILVANHQSMYDILPIIWRLRRLHPKFVSKASLGKGIPSVSYNLRHGGSVLIDRGDGRQAVAAIAGLGDYIEKHQRCAVIFPEGTRSRDGKPKPFQRTGLKVLLKKAPSAVLLPVTINGSWKMVRWGQFPLGIGSRIELIIHPEVAQETYPDAEALISAVETTIGESIRA